MTGARRETSKKQNRINQKSPGESMHATLGFFRQFLISDSGIVQIFSASNISNKYAAARARPRPPASSSRKKSPQTKAQTKLPRSFTSPNCDCAMAVRHPPVRSNQVHSPPLAEILTAPDRPMEVSRCFTVVADVSLTPYVGLLGLN